MLEIYQKKGMSAEDSKLITNILSKKENSDAWVDIMMIEELGIIVEEENPLWNALVTFIAFSCFGLMPILPYIVGHIAGTENFLF